MPLPRTASRSSSRMVLSDMRKNETVKPWLLVVEAVERAGHGVIEQPLAFRGAVAQVEQARQEDLVVADEGRVVVAELAVDLAPAPEKIFRRQLLVRGDVELEAHALENALGDLAHGQVL